MNSKHNAEAAYWIIGTVCVGLLLAGCAHDDTLKPVAAPVARDNLPAVPADIARCFNASLSVLPAADRDPTVEEVETAWKSDRLRAVIMAKCGNRFVAWYADLRKRWR